METRQDAGLIELGWRAGADWAEDALRDPLALLCDHAHCELRAASAAQALIERNPERGPLVERLARVAQEELRHFRQVHKQLRTRGVAWTSAGGNAYVEQLVLGARAARNDGSGSTREQALLERLLVAGWIEARSLERFELLASHSQDPGLAGFWAALAEAEREHAALYQALAVEFFGLERVRARAAQLRTLEAEVARNQLPGSRIHSGPPRMSEPWAGKPCA